MVAAIAPDDDAPVGPRARQRAQTRSRLVDAAREVFEEKGFLDVRISDIAERAGVSHGLFYHYFDSKQQIFRELAASVDQDLIDTMDVILDPASTASPDERLRAALHLHFERYRDDAQMMGVIEEVSRYDEGVDAAREAMHVAEQERLVRAIRQLQRRGLFDPRLDPVIAAVAIGSMTWRFAERWLVRGDLDGDFDEIVDQFTMLVMNALRLPDAPGGA